jgi:hypothetical protein
MASTLSSPRWHLIRTESRSVAMGDGWTLRFSAYGVLILTRFLPMALQWRDATVLLNFGSKDGRRRAGDSGAFQAKLGIGVGNLQGFSNDGKGMRGGGPRRRSLGGCLGMRGGTITGRRHGLELGATAWWMAKRPRRGVRYIAQGLHGVCGKDSISMSFWKWDQNWFWCGFDRLLVGENLASMPSVLIRLEEKEGEQMCCAGSRRVAC